MTEPLLFRGEAGTVTLTAAALTRLVAHAVSEVDGARLRRPKRGVEVRHDGGRAAVELELSGRVGASLHEVARAVQERVAEALGSVSGLDVERVDVSLEEIA